VSVDPQTLRWCIRHMSHKGRHGLSVRQLAKKFGKSEDEIRQIIDIAEQELEEKGEFHNRDNPARISAEEVPIDAE